SIEHLTGFLTMAKFTLPVTRFTFALLERSFPSAAARLAFSLFCRTPSRRPKTEKARKAEAEGRGRLGSAQRLSFPLRNSSVAAYRFNGAGGTAGRRYLVVHGWGSNSAYISALPAGLAASGAEVVVLDLPGHGGSSGRSLNMREAVEAIV